MFGGFGGFGASSAPAFGGGGGGFGQPAFGAPATTPAFGAPASTPAFGASTGFGAPAFGAPSTPAFGTSTSTPAFGASSSPGLGGGLFGASTTSAPAFGAPAPAFGALSPGPPPSPFGAPSGGSLFGGASTGSAFGAPASAPAFGAFGAPRPFGAPAPAASPFGTPPPASGTGLFGSPAPSFGAAGSAPGQGTRIAPFQKTVERDGTTTGTTSMANYMSITAMPQYSNKSVEELRFEDYQANAKSGPSGPTAQPFGQPAASSPFGAPASPSPFGGSSLFGAASSPASSPFGGLSTSTPAFGASTPPSSSPFGGGSSLFGAPASAPAFGASSAPAFGGGGAFGTPSTAPAFGSGASTFGTPGASSPFGASTGGGLFGSSAPAFGSQAPGSSPAPFSFGSSAPAFGSQQPSSTSAPAFGATPSLFGSPASGGGLFGSSTAASNPFGAASSPAPAFGASSSPFGGFGSAFAKPGGASAPFGASTGSSLFGSSAAAPAFGSSAPSFGGGFGGFGGFGSSAPASTSAPAFGSTSSAPAFGTTSPSIFGSSTPSLFGGGSAPSFSTGGLFGSSAVGMPGSQPAGAQIGAQPQVQPPSVAAAPYGSFPALPTVPEPKVGISARPARTIQTTGTSHASPLLSLRGAAGPKLGVQVRTPHVSPLGSAMFGGPTRAAPLARPGADGAAAAQQPPAPFPVRPNPHRLFIREPPPGTEPSASPLTSVGPAGAGNGVSWQPPSTPIAMTPLPRSPEAPPSFAPQAAATPSGLASPRSPTAAAAAAAAGAETGRGRELSLANGGSQRQVLADFTREATPEEDGGSAAVREVLPTLGRLASEGYTYEPSPTQLVAMHTLDPRSLHKVHNFTVTRAGIGSIRWLRPVDVVGLKLDSIVTIQQGEVFCYSDVEKPPLGQGLNLEAEITLYGVHKIDRATGAPVRDGPQLVKWEKSLRLMCLRMGAKFVAYKADGGVWRFEVEHFSRYGLLPEVEAEVEDPGAAGTSGPDVAGPGFGGTPASRTLHPSIARTPLGADRQPRFGTMMGMEDDEDEEVSLVPRGRGADASQADQGEAQGMLRAEGAYARGGTPLQHGLPAGLNLSPASLLALRDTFGTGSSSSFGAGGGRGTLSPPIEAHLGLLPNKRAKPTLMQPLAAPGAPEINAVGGDGAVPRGRGATVPAAYAARAAAAEGSPIMHSWRRSAAPLARPIHVGPSIPAPPVTLDHQGALVRAGGGVDGSTVEGGGGRLAARAVGVMWDEEEEEGDGVGVGSVGRGAAAAGGPGWADSGLIMARSFRASWGPGGMLVVPGRGIITGSGSSHPISLLHASPCGQAPPPTQNAPPPPLSRPDPLGLIEHAGADTRSQAATDMDGGEAAGVGSGAKEDLRQGTGPAALQRARLAATLEVHLQHSAPLDQSEHTRDGGMEEAAGQEGPDGLGKDVPRWQLRCTRESLKDFVAALTAALRRTLILPFGELSKQQQQEQQQQQPSWLEAEAVRVAYDMDTWQLLQVLFARLEPSMAPGILSGAATASAGGTQGPRTPCHAHSTSQGNDDEMMEASPAAPLGMGDGTPRLNKSASAVIRATSGGSLARPRSAGGSDGGGTPSHPDEASAPLLMAALRQGALSKWLQQQAAPRATTAIEKGVEGQGVLEPALYAVLQLMSARQLGAAAAVAAACGDITLATLVASSPAHAACQSEVAQQLRTWQASGVLGHVARGRLLVYQLLAGQVSEVSAYLNLDWRRHLGLLLWYHIRTTATPPTPTPTAPRGAASTTITANTTESNATNTVNGTGANPLLLPHQRAPATAAVDALRAYATTLMTQAHSSSGAGEGEGGAPWPHPLYMEEQQGRMCAYAHTPQDLQYVLLQLWRAHCEALAEAGAEAEARAQQGETAAEGTMGPRPVAGQAPVPELLVASSHSAHPSDCALPWMLCTALQGLGVVRGGAQHTQGAGRGELSADAAELMLASHMDLILQVQQAGGMPEWAIYVAMHLPDSAPAWQAAGHKPGSHSLRWHVVRELLVRSAPEWAGDGTKEAFLCDTLGVPTALVAEAVAVWAQHQGDFHTACTALMAAGQWHQAHELLALHVAPSLMLSKGYDRLETLLQDMAPHAPQLPDWHLGGGLYLHFLSTMSTLPSQHQKHHHQELTHLLDQLLQLSESLAAASAAVSTRAHTTPHLACVAAAVAPGCGAGGGANAGLSPHTLQQRVVLGAMARRVKSALLHVAHCQARVHGVGADQGAGLMGAGASGAALNSALGLAGTELGPSYTHVGAAAWHLGAAIV